MLSENSPLFRFLTRVADLMILNLVFLLTCLPVVTIGASLVALHHTAVRIVTDEHESVIGSYLKGFRENLGQATVLGLITLFLTSVLGAWYLVTENLAMSAVVTLLARAVLFVIAFRFALTLLYVFPYQATFEDSTWTVLNNARRMSLRHPFSSVTMIATTALPVVVSVYYPAVFAYGLLWLVIGFSGIAFANAVVLRRIFARYVPRES